MPTGSEGGVVAHTSKKRIFSDEQEDTKKKNQECTGLLRGVTHDSEECGWKNLHPTEIQV